jgi:probable F420-dependent oxidoreductase
MTPPVSMGGQLTQPFRFGLLAITPQPTITAWRELARRVEAHGYSTLSINDHFALSPVAPIPMLAALAGATTSLRLGTLVLNNDFRRPQVLAKDLATLDFISEGRLEIGMGAGWLLDDYETSTIPRDSPGIRVDRLEESLELLDAVLQGGPFTKAGRYVSAHDLVSVPRCVQKPRPPLLVGGGSERVLRLAGRTADIVSIDWRLAAGTITSETVASGSAEATSQKVDWVRAGAGNRFPELELHLNGSLTAICDDPKEGARQLLSAWGIDLEPEAVLESPHCFVGPVSRIVDRLHQVREQWGISYVSVSERLEEAFAPVVELLAGQ